DVPAAVGRRTDPGTVAYQGPDVNAVTAVGDGEVPADDDARGPGPGEPVAAVSDELVSGDPGRVAREGRRDMKTDLPIAEEGVPGRRGAAGAVEQLQPSPAGGERIAADHGRRLPQGIGTEDSHVTAEEGVPGSGEPGIVTGPDATRDEGVAVQ